MMITIKGKDSAPRLTSPGDSLLMLAYRCWHAGFDYGDAECWQYAWTALSNALGPRDARPVLGAVEDFVRCLRSLAHRRLDYYPPPCWRMSDSEHQVLELVAALQAGAPDVAEHVHHLCGAVNVEASRLVLTHAGTLARCLHDAGITVLAQSPALPSRRPLRSLH